MNSREISILHLEDRPADAEIIRHALAKAGLRFQIHRVVSEVDFRETLIHSEIDLVLADYSLPAFSGSAALALVRKNRPGMPFIFVSGTIGEEVAIESLRNGATDYILKDNLNRLGTAVQRALTEAQDQKRHALTQEQVRLQAAALESMASSVIITDAQGTILTVNPAFTGITGYLPEEVIGKNPRILKSRLQNSVVYEQMWRTITGGRTWRGEIYNRRKDGSLAAIEMAITPLRNAQGTITHFVATQQDVTERKQAEERISHLNQLLRAIRNINQLIVRENDLPTLFREACQILRNTRQYGLVWIGLLETGTSRLTTMACSEPAAGIQPGAWFEYDANPNASSPLSVAMRMLSPVVIEINDTRFAWPVWEQTLACNFACVAAVPLGSGASLLGAMLVYAGQQNAFDEEEIDLLNEMAEDLAFAHQSIQNEQKRQQAETALRESEIRLRQVIEASPIPLAYDNENKEVEYVNRKFVDTFGYPLADIHTSEQWFFRAYPDPQYRQLVWECWEHALQQARQNGSEVGPVEVNVTCHNGAVRTVEFVGSFVGSRLLVAAIDLTDKKRLEAQLLRSQRMECIGALAGGIAHDLNNILSPVLMVADMLGSKLTDEDSLQMIDLLKTSALRGADLVKQILSFARGSTKERLTLNPGYLARDMAKLAKDTFPRSIQIETWVMPGVYSICADPTQLHQILLNLCVNARDAMPDGGKLVIDVSNVELRQKYAAGLEKPFSGPFVVITVTDTGTGIAPELQERIYEPFFTTKEPGKGTGLGLSTVSSLIKSHHGFLEMNSTVGQGTAFKVYLPATFESQEPPVLASHLETPLGHGQGILLVDDDQAVLGMVKETLQAYLYHVLVARDGIEALRIYQQHFAEIQVVVTDLMMPVMDGPSLIHKVLEINPKARIVTVSGLASETLIKDWDRSQVIALVRKPFSAQQLLQAIHQALSHSGAKAVLI